LQLVKRRTGALAFTWRLKTIGKRCWVRANGVVAAESEIRRLSLYHDWNETRQCPRASREFVIPEKNRGCFFHPAN